MNSEPEPLVYGCSKQASILGDIFVGKSLKYPGVFCVCTIYYRGNLNKQSNTATDFTFLGKKIKKIKTNSKNFS